MAKNSPPVPSSDSEEETGANPASNSVVGPDDVSRRELLRYCVSLAGVPCLNHPKVFYTPIIESITG